MKGRVSLRAVLLWICGAYVVLLSFGYHYGGSIPRHRLETGGWILFGVALLCSAFARRLLRAGRPALAPLVPARLPTPAWMCLGGLVALVAGLAAYWPVLFVGLVMDDYQLIPDAARGFVEGGADARFRPAAFLLWRTVVSLGGGDVGLHLLNVSFHVLNAVLTYLVALRLGLSPRQAAVSAAVFLVLPTSVEAVAWIAALPDVLTTTFCLLVLIALGGEARLSAVLLASAAFLAALGTKETAVAIPAIAVAAYGGRTRGVNAWWVGGAAAVAAGFAAWRIATPLPAEFPEYLQPLSRYLVQKMLSMTAGALAVPWKQAALDAWPVAATLWSAAVTAVLTRHLVRGVDDVRVSETTWRLAVWIALSIAPVYSWFFISPELMGGRYLYLAAPAWSMLCGAMLEVGMQGGRRRATAAAATCGVVLAAALFLGLRTSVDAWVAASRVRDAVIASAASTLQASACERTAFLRLPHDVDGAFVFGNGFLRALDHHRAPGRERAMVAAEGVDPACRFVWDEARLQFTPGGDAD